LQAVSLQELNFVAALQAAILLLKPTQGVALGCCTFSPSGWLKCVIL
jgi:hypothetical protein